MANDNDLTRVEQRDVPVGEAAQESQRSWVTVVEAAVAGAIAQDVYNDVKAAGKAIVDKFREPPSPPPPPGDGGNET